MKVSLTEYKVHPTGHFDNHPREYSRVESVPLACAMGAEIRGVDLRRLDEEQFREISDALYHHKMIYFRDQEISFEDQENITRRFGPFATDAYNVGVPGHPNIQKVVKEKSSKTPYVFGGSWHTDSPFLQRPPVMVLLYANEVPPYGGDTWWANTELAYEYLSDTMKNLLKQLRIHWSAQNVVRLLQETTEESRQFSAGSTNITVGNELKSEGCFHPLIRKHPVTGKLSLYVDETYTVGIEGMSNAEAETLVNFLCSHITQPVFTCRLRWEAGTLAIWDNRSTLHHAFNDYAGFRREMHRTIVSGEKPLGHNEKDELAHTA